MVLLTLFAYAAAAPAAADAPATAPAVCPPVRPPPVEFVDATTPGVGIEGGVQGGVQGGARASGGRVGPLPCELVHYGAIAWKPRPDIGEAGAPPTDIDIRCVLRVDLDSNGTPTAAEPRSCPEAFVPAARAALLAARAYAQRVDGVAIPVRVDWTLIFKAPKPRDEAPAEPTPG